MTMPDAQFDHNSGEFIENPFPVYERLRAEDPVHYSANYGGYYILTRYKDVREALLNWRGFSSGVPGTTSIPTSVRRDFPEIPLEVDPPEHATYRKIVSGFFTRKAIDDLEPGIRAVAEDLVRPMVAAGGGDLVQDFALPLVSRSLALFLKVPMDDTVRWIRWAKDIFHGRITDRASADAAGRDMLAYVDDIVARRRADPGDDLFSELATATYQGRPLTTEELRGFGILFLNAGQETTVSGIGNSLWYLAENPEDRRRLRAEPALMASAIEEFLRFMSPVQLLGRTTAGATELHGCVIPDRATVAIGYGSANRDPAVFPEPDRCVLDRRPNPHLAFGAGPHACIGAHLARTEMRVALDVVLRVAADYRIEPDAQAEFTPHGDLRGFWKLPVRFG